MSPPHPGGRAPSLLLALLVALVALLSNVASISAAGPIKLGVTPVGVAGGNFVITMQPGESRDLAVKLGNFGAEPVLARTFAADASSMVNGGFAVRLDGEPTNGTTHWLTYLTENIDLAPGADVQRDFTIAVPADTQPGEYLTSIVLQNADATSDDTGGVVFKQIVRQVVAVSIDVPGLRTPALELGAITQRTVADRSLLAVEVHNTGNVRLKPAGEFTLWDGAGTQLTTVPITMDTVYAHTDTSVEIPFAQRLNPGAYTAELDLTDPSGLSASSSKLPLIIPEVVVDTTPHSVDAAPQVAQTNQTPVAASVAAAASTDPMVLAMIAFGAGLALTAAAFGIGFMVYRRRKHREA